MSGRMPPVGGSAQNFAPVYRWKRGSMKTSSSWTRWPDAVNRTWICVEPVNWPVENLRTGERLQPPLGVTVPESFVFFGYSTSTPSLPPPDLAAKRQLG